MKDIHKILLVMITVVSCNKKSSIIEDAKPKAFTTKTYYVPSYRSNADTMVITMKDTAGTVHLAWKARPFGSDYTSNNNYYNQAELFTFSTRLTITTSTNRSLIKNVSYTGIGVYSKSWYEYLNVPPYQILHSITMGYVQDGTFSVTLKAGEIVRDIEVTNTNEMVKPNLE